MAAHLLKGGCSLRVYNRTREKAEGLLARGARWASGPGEAAREADVVITMVGYPEDVEQIYLSAGAIVEQAKPGAVLIDMTTSSPALARRIAEAAKVRGIISLDAPVSGGDVGAKNAALSIMAGGDEGGFKRMLPVFTCMGKNIILQGGSGAGQYCKMSNQIAIASTMVAVSEALVYGLKAGLDPRTMLKSIESGAAGSWSLSNLVPRMIRGDFTPGFFVKHFIKDMGIAVQSAAELGIELPGLERAQALYRTLAGMDRKELEETARIAAALGGPGGLEHPAIEAARGGDLGTQAIFLLYAAGRLCG
jgi:3-hydroxyisobutyrate dehydrogenase